MDKTGTETCTPERLWYIAAVVRGEILRVFSVAYFQSKVKLITDQHPDENSLFEMCKLQHKNRPKGENQASIA